MKQKKPFFSFCAVAGFLMVFAAGVMAAKSPTEQWILACQNVDGGFGLYPGDGSNLLGTFGAVHSLKLLNAKIPSSTRIISYILSKQRPEGGFCNRFGNRPDEATLQMTYYAVKTLSTLNALPKEIKPIVNWIHSRQLPDGGYLWDNWIASDVPDKSSTRSGYYAVEALSVLGAAPNNRDSVVAWLSRRQTMSEWKNGSFEEQNLAAAITEMPQAVGMVFFTGMGLHALKTLGATCPMPDSAITYLKNVQKKDGGIGKGLGRYHCYDDRDVCRMQDAYYGAMGLEVLNARFIDEKGLGEWVKRCLRSDGGFGRRPEDSPTDMEATYEALCVLAFLKLPFPSPEKPIAPVREPNAPAPAFPCEQVKAENPDDVRFLYRIAKPIYDKNIGQGEFAVAKALMTWVNDHLLFCSNWNHSGSQAIIDGLGACGTHGRAFNSLANAVGLHSRMLYIAGHGLAESKINGRWVMMDPMFVDWGHDEKGELKSALAIHENFLDRGRFWARFGDWRYESFKVELPDGSVIEISKTDRVKEALAKKAYGPDEY